MLPKIRDAAGQKGTGKWTAISALNYGVPVTLIGEAVFSRCLSSLKDERKLASKLLPKPSTSKFSGDKKQFLENLRQVCIFNIPIVLFSLKSFRLSTLAKLYRTLKDSCF